MQVLVIGQGGREHAIARSLSQSSHITKIYIAPGNAGMALTAKCENVPYQVDEVAKLKNFALENNIAYTIVGPEVALGAGITDAFQAANLLCLGPTQFAAQLETSKIFSKEFMLQFNIPTAQFAKFTDTTSALTYLQTQSMPIVIKADGLAAGKGVIIAENRADAQSAVKQLLAQYQRIVIEEFIQGVEASYIILTDGEHILPLATAQDYKRRDADPASPNTGGMGTLTPAPFLTAELEQKILTTVIQPALKGMQTLGCRYVGFLFAGIMITPQREIKVLEFNCRLGDPETQVILARLDSDLHDMCWAAVHHNLKSCSVMWKNDAAVCVVLAAKNYPAAPITGEVISGLTTPCASAYVLHAATRMHEGEVVSAGGRVLNVVATGKDIAEARAHAYARVKTIHWDSMFCREDIGLLD
jgi:phosphoribosylamine--glycine ligase